MDVDRHAILQRMTFPQLVESMQELMRLERIQRRVLARETRQNMMYPVVLAEALRATQAAVAELAGELARRMTPLDFGVWWERPEGG